jgi:hypothetical protein
MNLSFLPDSAKLYASNWQFDTSEGAEFSAAVFSASKGSFYVKDKTDTDGILHEILYVGLGFNVGKSLPVGGSFSTPEMYSEGVGPILLGPGKSTLWANDFGGTGLIMSGSLGFVGGISHTIIYFGYPKVKAVGRMRGAAWMAPSAGFGWMPVWFAVDP